MWKEKSFEGLLLHEINQQQGCVMWFHSKRSSCYPDVHYFCFIPPIAQQILNYCELIP